MVLLQPLSLRLPTWLSPFHPLGFCHVGLTTSMTTKTICAHPEDGMVRTQGVRWPHSRYPCRGTCVRVLGDREEADQTQANRRSRGRHTCTWVINAMAAPLSSESRAKPTRQVQPSPRKATSHWPFHPLLVASDQFLMNNFQSPQEGWHFSSPTDDDPESGGRCGGYSCCQTPQCSRTVRKYRFDCHMPCQGMLRDY